MATVITWLDEVFERGTRIIPIDLVDEDGNAVTPKTAKFTLTDGYGEVVNEKKDIDIVPLASSMSVVLEGADLDAGNGLDDAVRYFTLKATYDSSYGSGLPINGCCAFKIIELPQT